MVDQQNSVSVFHFTDRISTAKLKKYTESTSRGMANARKSAEIVDSTAAAEPATKKPRFKLNGPRRDSDESGDTINVSRPKRSKEQNIRFKYSDDMVMTSADPVAPAKVEFSHPPASPAPSSGLSSLSSAPPSERETSPFVDPEPEPSSRQDYGDFMSYYIDGGDDEPEPIARPRPIAKPATKPASKPRKSTPKAKVPKDPAQAADNPAAAPTATQQAHSQISHPTHRAPTQQGHTSHHGHAPQPNQLQAPQLQHFAQQQHQQHQQHQQQLHLHHQQQLQQQQHQTQPPQQPHPHASRVQHGSPALPLHSTGQGPPRPAAIPQPTIQFNEIVHDPPPAKPLNVGDMIAKLRELSLALTTFGGAAPAPPLSPSPPPTPVKTTPDGVDNPLDNFLSFFDGDGDDDSNEMDRELKDLGTPDEPLMHGIVFIQNALKSWAQQRVSQMYTQQYHQQLQIQQQTNPKRGPGRPRKFDDPSALLPLSPVIQMDLALTPEGNAIKAFQAVLHSACLRVNVRLPAALASALRQLYMQIDLLINQGERPPQADWQCMSYRAQISAHKNRVDRWKAHQAKLQEETQRQQSLAHQTMMAQMGLPPQQHYPMTPAQAEHAHAVELETRRAQAHAHQQPYIRQQHLNPLQLGIHPSGPPASFVPSQPAHTGMRPPSAGPFSVRGDPMVQVMQQNGAPMQHNTSSSPGVQLDKMKLYVPGFLRRSGQNIKFSFAPQGTTAGHGFGSHVMPGTDGSGSAMPDRGLMSAAPSPASLQPSVDLTATSTTGTRPSSSSNGPNAMIIDGAVQPQHPAVQSLTPGEQSEQVLNGNFRPEQRPQTPVVATHGFTAVNAPAARTSSAPVRSPTDTSPETIKVASKKSTGSAAASASPRSSKKRSASVMNGHRGSTTIPSNFPHPGAVVLDQ